MNINVTPIRINEAKDWSEKHEIGKDEHELIEAAVNHYKEHLDRQFHENVDHASYWTRRRDEMRSQAFRDAGRFLGSKITKLGALSDQIAGSHSIRIIPDEDQ